jgi:hypothetical protein
MQILLFKKVINKNKFSFKKVMESLLQKLAECNELCTKLQKDMTGSIDDQKDVCTTLTNVASTLKLLTVVVESKKEKIRGFYWNSNMDKKKLESMQLDIGKMLEKAALSGGKVFGASTWLI